MSSNVARQTVEDTWPYRVPQQVYTSEDICPGYVCPIEWQATPSNDLAAVLGLGCRELPHRGHIVLSSRVHPEDQC